MPTDATSTAPATKPQPQIVMAPLLLDIRGASAVCQLSIRNAERLLSRGRFPQPDVRIGRLRRWRPESLAEWVGNGCGNAKVRA